MITISKTKEENEDREKLQTESPGMSGSSGIGGKPFGLPDLRSIQEAAAKGQQRGGAPGRLESRLGANEVRTEIRSG